MQTATGFLISKSRIPEFHKIAAPGHTEVTIVLRDLPQTITQKIALNFN
jgi:hypothetical protein